MKIKFCGANREVTGSCHMLQTAKKNILVDCGMYQGSNFNDSKNHADFPFDPSSINTLLVTHAHLDHIGRIPKLVKQGFKGQIYMTKATCEFSRLVWEDAYSIMTYENKKFGVPILYEEKDIAAAATHCVGIEYNQPVDLGDGITAVWKDAGHIFGSAFIEVSAEGKTVAFSGDIGNDNVPILRETQSLSKNIDVLLSESTYGDRLHEDIDTRRSLILKLIVGGINRGGTIMIPAFSLERTQELLYELNLLSEHDHSLPSMPIYVDSPLAIDATAVYKKYPQYYDTDAKELHDSGDDFFAFPNLRMTHTQEESKQINSVKGPKMVIAGAGMMNGGRILHHALRYLSDPKSTLIIVGYQAEGTLGRRLYEGATRVKVYKEDVKVRCAVKAIGALSAHGDQAKLMRWIGSSGQTPKQVFCVHGEPHAATELAHRLRDKYGIEAGLPAEGDEVEI